MTTLLFDKNTKLIEVAAPDTEITIQQLIDDIRDYEDNLVNHDIAKIANAAGKDDLGGGVQVGITLTLLDGWNLQFEARPNPPWEVCTVKDGNLVATDITGGSIAPINATDYVNVIQLGAIATSIATVSGTGGNGADLSAISGVMNESLSAYEATGVASKIDIDNISVTMTSADLDYIVCGVVTGSSGAIVSGIGDWGDLRWSKIHGIPLSQYDILITQDDE